MADLIKKNTENLKFFFIHFFSNGWSILIKLSKFDRWFIYRPLLVYVMTWLMSDSIWRLENFGNTEFFQDYHWWKFLNLYKIQFSYVSWHIIWKSGDSVRKFKMADPIWRSEYWRCNNMLMKKRCLYFMSNMWSKMSVDIFWLRSRIQRKKFVNFWIYISRSAYSPTLDVCG